MYSYELAGHPAHIIAATCYCLSIAFSFHETLENAWIPVVQFVAGLELADIRPVIATLAGVLCAGDYENTMPVRMVLWADEGGGMVLVAWAL